MAYLTPDYLPGSVIDGSLAIIPWHIIMVTVALILLDDTDIIPSWPLR